MGKQTGNVQLNRLWFRPVIECPMDTVEGLTLNAHRHQGELIAFLPKERPTAEDLKSGGPTDNSDVRHDSSDQPIRMALEKTGFSAPLPVAEQLRIVPDELPTPEEAKPGRSTHDPDAKLNLSKQPIGMACEAFHLSAQLPEAEQLSLFPNELQNAEDGLPPRDLGSQDDSSRLATPRQNIDFAAGPQRKGSLINQFPNDRRILSSLARFFIAALMGGGAMFALQYASGEASKEARTEITPLDQLSTLSTAMPMLEAIYSSSDEPNEIFGIPALTPSWAGSVPGTVAASSALAPQLETIARNLADLRRRTAQLAEKQDQMAANMAALQAIEQNIGRKISSPIVTRVVVPLPPRRKTPGVTHQHPAARPYAARRPLPLH